MFRPREARKLSHKGQDVVLLTLMDEPRILLTNDRCSNLMIPNEISNNEIHFQKTVSCEI